MAGYVISHPRREVRQFGALRVYYDGVTHNQDPYVWSERFLHTACHITQMTPEIGHINFWVSAGVSSLRDATALYCDLVFVVGQRLVWRNRNEITSTDPIVDSPEAFHDHYGWYGVWEHRWVRRTRYTLKADSERSFQPQSTDQSLIDIVPGLEALGIGPEAMKSAMKAGFQTRPYRLDDRMATVLYAWVDAQAAIKLKGPELRAVRQQHSDELAGRYPLPPTAQPNR
jgi:hypothetical protein